MTNITDARNLAKGLRDLGVPEAGLMAHTIEAALDDALQIPLAEGEQVLALNAADAKLLRASLQITLTLIDGADPDFAPATELLQRIVALDFEVPVDPTEAPEEPASDAEDHWRDDEQTGPLDDRPMPGHPSTES